MEASPPRIEQLVGMVGIDVGSCAELVFYHNPRDGDSYHRGSQGLTGPISMTDDLDGPSLDTLHSRVPDVSSMLSVSTALNTDDSME